MKNSSGRAYIAYFLLFSILFVLVSFLLTYLSTRLIKPNSEKQVLSDTESRPVVIIDAGHGGEDGGAIGVNGAFEKDINLSIAKKIEALLSQKGIKCVLTRDEDILLYDRKQDYQGRKKILDMQARKKIVEGYENAIFISIHQNSFGQAKYSGFQAYYSPNDARSYELVSLIERSVKNNLQPNNKRASKVSNGNIYLLDHINCPAVLLECGFLSNADECALLCTEDYQNKLCEVICAGIEEFVN